ncbi:efflux RND transporter permease subunit [Frigoriglobus tundricola]|uniref:CzcABC family efflux RND transporter, transmembrane protein n=1 Tax=Frigoriglobus tundricola TaxID=2774151 RepID=A0A6M5YUJ9_9BACT|nr:efflux RND transporter permease subunit [Frigoriglobus tundricola]QJW97589.1 CzcABC family efflux RND transporter, transmembrane protein [Frigoriglobus tundricola]
MLTALISNSIRLRVVVLALCVVLLVVGSRSIRRAPLDVFPEFAPPLVEIQTEAPGLSTNEVESLVSMPIENALNGVPHVKTVRSKSVLGLSQVVLVLEDGSDPIRVRQMVQERIAAVTRQLPTVALPPIILQPLSSTSRVMKIGILSAKGANLTQRDLTEVVMWTVRPKLMSVPGVANVAVWGQRDKQFQVIVDPDELRINGVTLDMVSKAAGDAVALDGGGFVDTPNQRIAVRHTQAVRTPGDLGRAVVDPRGGAALRIKDVARVQFGSPPAIGDSVINDEPGIMLIVEKQPESNTLELTRKVEAAIEALRPGLTGVEVDTTIFRPATFIERAIDNLSHALVVGCVLVAVILVVFLFDWRTAVISLTAIPLSLVAALLVFAYSGATINTMVLAGLVIALGEVVDDAIIDVENIARRLRLAAARPAGAGRRPSAFEIVLAASLEVRSAVVYASLIVVLVFLPVFFLDGLSGAFFRPLALAYVIAIAASLFVALTVTPAMSYMLLTGRPRAGAHDPPLTRALKRGYRLVLPAFVARPWHCLASLVLAFAVTGVAATRLGQEFLPNFQETDFLMHFVEKPGTSVEAMHRVTAAASRELRTLENEKGQKLVNNFGSHIGRAEVADEPVGPNFTELWISIPGDVDYEPSVKKIADVVYAYPGLYRDLLTYLRERIKEVLTGASGAVVVRLYGPDTAVLRAKAKEVEAAMKDVEGVTNLKVEPQVLVAQIDVRLRPEDLAKYGLTPGHVRRASTTLLKGQKVGEVFDGQKKFDVVVWGAGALRTDLSAVQNLPIDIQDAQNGTQVRQVRLMDVADVQIVSAPNEVRRENASRRLDVTCNVSGRDLGSVAREVEAKVRQIPFEREYHPEFLGEYQARQESTRKLYALAGLALVGIVLLLFVDFGTWRPTLLVALTIPFALVGGVFSVTISTGVVSLGSLVGFVTVLGIAARNGIMLVSHFRHLEAEEGVPFGVGLVLRGAEERLAPILMTALATGLALLPLAVTGNKPGQEIEYPLAVVILGGLITSTLLNLFLLPPLYARFGRPVEKADGE